MWLANGHYNKTALERQPKTDAKCQKTNAKTFLALA
jgi:hypothetical protein